MADLLEIRNLEVSFFLNNRIIDAVAGVNLDVNKAEVVVLAGESGSGKTVTALAITGIIPPQAQVISGSITFMGKNLLTQSQESLRSIRGKEIAYIFQEPTSYLNPVYSIGNQIAEAVILHQNKTKARAYEETLNLLELVRIDNPKRVLQAYPHQLSGGMNQRAFLAMALACTPRLLIADEPTTALDVTTEYEILNLLMDLRQKLNFSLLFITHNLAIAKRIADRICVMYKGKVVETGAREKIFSAPEHFHTRQLISAYERIGKL